MPRLSPGQSPEYCGWDLPGTPDRKPSSPPVEVEVRNAGLGVWGSGGGDRTSQTLRDPEKDGV